MPPKGSTFSATPYRYNPTKGMTKEQKAAWKQDNEDRRRYRKAEREQAAEERQQRARVKRELGILKFMLKTDVLYNHHGRADSLKGSITEAIEWVKRTGRHTHYHSYIWNYQDSSYMPYSWLGCIFRSSEFETIYDVPLDGTYVFYTYDSGQRGLGSFNRMTVRKVETVASIPTVNPGGIIPTTAF
jgi:hypothetical protein